MDETAYYMGKPNTFDYQGGRMTKVTLEQITAADLREGDVFTGTMAAYGEPCTVTRIRPFYDLLDVYYEAKGFKGLITLGREHKLSRRETTEQ